MYRKKNDDGSDRQEIISAHCSVGDSLVLKHDVDNQFDECAIAVYHENTNLQIGYLSHYRAREIFAPIEEGLATVTHITGGTGNNPMQGVNNKIINTLPDKRTQETIFDYDDGGDENSGCAEVLGLVVIGIVILVIWLLFSN